MSKIALVCAAALAAPALVSCIPKPDATEAAINTTEGAACDSNVLQRYIGKRFTAVLAEQMRKESRSIIVRTGPTDGVVTMDYNSARLNVFYNDEMLIAVVNCG